MRSEYEVFIKAAESGNMDALEQIVARFSPEEVQAMIQAKERYGRDVDYAAFRKAAANGHLDVMKRLRELAPDQVQAMIQADVYAAFRDAASHGHLNVMEWLRELAPDRVQMMIQAVDYFAYRFASGRHPAVIERLIAWSAPETVSKMIKASGGNFIRDSGLFDIMERLVEIAPNQLKAIIPEENYALFREAAFDGRLAVMELLIALVPDQVQAMIKANAYAAFVEAAGHGHLAVMERLMELAPDQVQAMIKAGDYYAFIEAAGHGHLAVMDRLRELAPDQVPAMIQADNYAAFRWVARCGNLAVMARLMELAPNQVQAMIKANDRHGYYAAFRDAASYGHLAVMERLIGQSTPYRVQEMIQADDYAAFRNAVNNGHTNVIHYLLTFPNMLAWAEQHEHEYGSRYVYPFVSEHLQSLRTQKSALETENPNAVFDIDAEKAKLCFFMLRNLIRRNDASINDDIRFLLDIPAVKSIVHTQVTQAGPNELLRLAMTTDRNPEAAGILLTIPAVRRQAEQNHFYRHEVRGGLDLQALAQDRESSMRALSIGEQKRLDRAFKRYQPMLEEAGGVEAVFQSFIDVLNARYQARPAQIRTGDGRDIALPVTRGEFNHLFNALQLSEETRERARLAYYQHKDHTALRYVSRPNAWMADHAAYVNHDSNGSWSTFEEYKPLISMLWLAATDTGIAPTDGHTLETRINHFIDEIALLGRAHNWDSSRPILDDEGAPILDEQGHVIREEFDDGEGDKPSCYSGVKRRLFQSVLGHPLLKILTLDDIKQELRDFVRDYFKQHITDSNRDAIRTAWVNLCESGIYDATQHDSLNTLNIPSETQITFIQHLGEKYPAQFNDELTFKRYIESQFLMDERFQTHAARFGGQTDLNGLLIPPALIMRSIITSSDLHKAKSRLSRCGELGEAVIAEINCLKSGSISLGSATWTGSAEKLSAIVTAVKALPEMSAEDLVAILMNEHSDLCKSLTQSISTVVDAEPPDATFLKKIQESLDQYQLQNSVIMTKIARVGDKNRGYDYLAPDQSEITLLTRSSDADGGDMAYCSLPINQTSVAVCHKTIHETWYFTAGVGEFWIKKGDQEEVYSVHKGSVVSLPKGTLFQFRNTSSDEALEMVIVTMPPWPGEGEAIKVNGKWTTSFEPDEQAVEENEAAVSATAASEVASMGIFSGAARTDAFVPRLIEKPEEYHYLAPDMSEIRLLTRNTDASGGDMAHCTLPAGQTSTAVKHKSIHELWYITAGEGEIWLKDGEIETVHALKKGSYVSIPLGASFQFRTTGSESLEIVITSMPPWPGADEAVLVNGKWPTVMASDELDTTGPSMAP